MSHDILCCFLDDPGDSIVCYGEVRAFFLCGLKLECWKEDAGEIHRPSG